ncbi:hypothetical protein H3N56_02485 [Cetobacterium sp. 2A]|uniref:hypothetical protein n=1 Tax=Cetobacterium sp. 2A TaxID=2754723 RepID=UPI00163CB4DA|nr:hypothetical protein [Cetobacterium sp. 2A]MBC2855360.1 hypothetical protein [Cetobacterium sp. 2A]
MKEKLTAEEILKETERVKGAINTNSKKIDVDTLGTDEEVDYSSLKLKNEFKGSYFIEFNTELTGKQILLVKSKYERERKKKAKFMAEMDDFFYLMMAELMTGINYSEFLELPVQDYTRLKNHVAAFLGEE